MAIKSRKGDNSYVLTEKIISVTLKDTTLITDVDSSKLVINDDPSKNLRVITYDGDPVDNYVVDVSYSLHDNLGIVTNRVTRYDGEWK